MAEGTQKNPSHPRPMNGRAPSSNGAYQDFIFKVGQIGIFVSEMGQGSQKVAVFTHLELGYDIIDVET